MTAKERRVQRAKYARRNKMHLIDKLLNELEMLNLADQRQMPPVALGRHHKVIESRPSEPSWATAARLRDGGDGRPVRDPGQPDVQPDRGRVTARIDSNEARSRLALQPFGHEPVVGVDVDLAQPAAARIHEFVREHPAGRPHLSRPRIDRGRPTLNFACPRGQ